MEKVFEQEKDELMIILVIDSKLLLLTSDSLTLIPFDS